MIGLAGARRYFLYRAPTDMRKSFTGLCGLVRNGLGHDPMSGDGFVFVNQRRTLIKVLIWDRNGYVIYYKKLERGTIQLPQSAKSTIVISTLVMMLEGIELNGIKHRKRYRLSGSQRA